LLARLLNALKAQKTDASTTLLRASIADQ
jgi:hypothetical protein